MSSSSTSSHVVVEQLHLNFGSPTILLSTVNEDGTFHLSVTSDALFKGANAVVGLDGSSFTAANIRRTGECVINIAGEANALAVQRLMDLSQLDQLPRLPRNDGSLPPRDDFDVAGMTALSSISIAPKRVHECPIHLEAYAMSSYGLKDASEKVSDAQQLFELRVQRIHVLPSLLGDRFDDRISAEKWKPLITVNDKLYGLRDRQSSNSMLEAISRSLAAQSVIERLPT